jgi:dihydropyrimidinase
MSEYDLLIINGVVVTETDNLGRAVAIKDGKIAAFIPKSEQPYPSADKVIDAKGGCITVCVAREWNE